MQLTWIASVSASCCHAAEALARGLQLADATLQQELAAPVSNLKATILTASLPEHRLWQFLSAFAHHYENNLELARVALHKTVGASAASQAWIAKLAGHIGDIEAAMRQVHPQLAADLTHRIRPLQEQWEARGPGLLHAIGQLTDPRLIAERAEVVLVHPALGGHAAAHLVNNSVRMEALLTNVVPGLPEVLRLGWCLAQLQLDLPMFADRVHRDRLESLAPLALLPAALQAGEEIELCTYSPQTLAAALSAWRVQPPETVSLEDILQTWWATYCDTKPSWDIALAALDQMLRP
jgi:hypothetical protein